MGDPNVDTHICYKLKAFYESQGEEQYQFKMRKYDDLMKELT